VFHDHSGSYVEVLERPIHTAVFERLWRATDVDGNRYPYKQSWPNLTLDPGFESRVDAQFNPNERAALLLGLLKWGSLYLREGRHVPTMHLLVRKPTLPSGSAVTEHRTRGMPIPRDTSHTTFDEEFAKLRPSTPEHKWLKLAVDRLIAESDEFYGVDLPSGGGTSEEEDEEDDSD
jgi:hypothetical protein